MKKLQKSGAKKITKVGYVQKEQIQNTALEQEHNKEAATKSEINFIFLKSACG